MDRAIVLNVIETASHLQSDGKARKGDIAFELRTAPPVTEYGAFSNFRGNVNSKIGRVVLLAWK